MSEASRQLLIEALQKAKKNRQERLGRKKEVKEIGSALSSEVTEGQKTQADLAIEEALSDPRFRGTLNTPTGTTGTGSTTTVNLGEEEDVYDQQALEGYTYGKKANGGKIPKFKRRTLKFR
jgi:hypothetical protein